MTKSTIEELIEKSHELALQNVSFFDVISELKNTIAIQYHGKEEQSIVAAEECSELVQSITKQLRGKNNIPNLTEEIADVLIVISQLIQMYKLSDEDIIYWILYKQEREMERIDAEKKAARSSLYDER